ncbi:hypothetical protein [Vibrio sp. ER1A]|uniref:hypothetical protein n=1 Tax=Vibrio sp. ER1A TaxID=1517681 RepID=UPI0004DCD0A7|nr:hypothetical protein [Vibrio sp. ER1A]KFA99390.1 hypothetical protein HW45_04135 [Vibrio sp. ER1A]
MNTFEIILNSFETAETEDAVIEKFDVVSSEYEEENFLNHGLRIIVNTVHTEEEVINILSGICEHSFAVQDPESPTQHEACL